MFLKAKIKNLQSDLVRAGYIVTGGINTDIIKANSNNFSVISSKFLVNSRAIF